MCKFFKKNQRKGLEMNKKLVLLTAILMVSAGPAFADCGACALKKDKGAKCLITEEWKKNKVAKMTETLGLSADQVTQVEALLTEKVEKKKAIREEYKTKFLNPYVAAKQGRVDLIIDPKDTRKTLVKCLEMTINKTERMPSKKHGTIPL